jgi:hypothetical protein
MWDFAHQLSQFNRLTMHFLFLYDQEKYLF